METAMEIQTETKALAPTQPPAAGTRWSPGWSWRGPRPSQCASSTRSQPPEKKVTAATSVRCKYLHRQDERVLPTNSLQKLKKSALFVVLSSLEAPKTAQIHSYKHGIFGGSETKNNVHVYEAKRSLEFQGCAQEG